MFARGRYAGAACLAALAMIGMAGCSGPGDRPQTLPPLHTTPAATSSPEPTDSQASELAAATAVVRKYFRLKNSIGIDMNPAPLAALETANCSCRKFGKSVRDTRSRGEHYFGRALHISATPALNGSQSATVLVSYDTTVGGTKNDAGKILYKGAARQGITALFTLVRVGKRWLIADIANIRPGLPDA